MFVSLANFRKKIFELVLGSIIFLSAHSNLKLFKIYDRTH